MAKNSKIEWTDHTFNPWMGCTKVSPGCAHCYAEEMMDHRYGKVKWGPQGMRVRTSNANWKKPLKWNKEEWEECIDCGWRGPVSDTHVDCSKCDGENMKPARQRVFCASLADVGDHHPSVMNEWVEDLVRLIYQTRHLDWLFLTKRMEDMTARFSMFWGSGAAAPWPDNVWVGVSVESQKEANERIPLLQNSPARIKFLSCEPLLGPIDLGEAVEPDDEAWHEVNAMDHNDPPEEFIEECEAECDWINYGNDLVTNPEYLQWKERRRMVAGFRTLRHGAIDWVICGGESGPKALPMKPMWAQSLRNECREAGIPFFFKQWGEWFTSIEKSDRVNGHLIPPSSKYCVEWGKDWFPVRVGKKAAGRLLDGREWSEIPQCGRCALEKEK